MKNWKTFVAGLIVGIPQLLISSGIVEANNRWVSLATSVGAIVLGLVAKDNNVTGGTVRQPSI